ncbi:hypothetical protein GCM10018954_038000 [Kutzneria kofuensis]
MFGRCGLGQLAVEGRPPAAVSGRVVVEVGEESAGAAEHAQPPQRCAAQGHHCHQGQIGRGCIKFARNDACSFCSIRFGGMWRNSVPSAEAAWQVIHAAHTAGYDYLYLTADELPLMFGRLLLWRSWTGCKRGIGSRFARSEPRSRVRGCLLG